MEFTVLGTPDGVMFAGARFKISILPTGLGSYTHARRIVTLQHMRHAQTKHHEFYDRDTKP